VGKAVFKPCAPGAALSGQWEDGRLRPEAR